MSASAFIQIKPIKTGATWTTIKCPSTYKMTSTTLVDSARNSKGVVVATVVREGIRKLEMSWNYLTVAEFSTIAKLFEGSDTGGNGAFDCYVRYFDTIIGQQIDSENGFLGTNTNTQYGVNTARPFYVGDRITDTAKIKIDSSFNVIGYENVKLSLIEK